MNDLVQFVLNGAFQLIGVGEVIIWLFAETDYFFCKLQTAFATFCPYFRKSYVYAHFFTFCLYKIKLCLGICWESIDSNYTWKFVYICNIAYMFQKVRETFFKSLKVLVVQVSFCNAAIVFQSTNSCNNNNSVWFQTCHTAFDVKEFLSTKVSAEASLCNCVISQFQRHFCSCYRVTAMSDISEWSAVYDCRNMLKSLNKVWFQSVFQKCCHSALSVKIACCYRFLLRNFTVCISDDDSGKTFFQVFDIACKTQNCHDLRSNSNVVAVFTRHTVCLSAKAVYYITKLTVIHIHTSSPCDLSRVNVKSVALENMVVDHCCKKVVCCADCMEVTCKMKVDIFHRNNLCIAAACCAAFYTCSCFSLACRCRVDSCNKDQLAVLFVGFFQKIVVDFCFVLSVLLQIFVINTCFCSDLSNWFHFAFLCDFDVTLESHKFVLLS